MATELETITHEINEIYQKIDEISALKSELEKQAWTHALPVEDIEGTELTAENIAERIRIVAESIVRQYPDAKPVLIALMDGGMPFASALSDELTRLDYFFQMTSMQVSSYGSGKTSGELKTGSMPKLPLGARTVLLIDDVCDTGNTYRKTSKLIREQLGAKSVGMVALVDKVQQRKAGSDPEIAGFKIPKDAFIIGFGLDYCGGLLRGKKSIVGANPDFEPTAEQKALLDSEKALNERLKLLLVRKTVCEPASRGVPSFFVQSLVAEPAASDSTQGLHPPH